MTINILFFAFLFAFLHFSITFGPCPLWNNYYQAHWGYVQFIWDVFLPSDHTSLHIFRIFDAFLYFFTTFNPCPLWNNYYQAHWGYVPPIWDCFLDFWIYFLKYFSHFWCIFVSFFSLFGPCPLWMTIIRLIKGVYHPYEIVSLTSDYTFLHIFRIFDAFLYFFHYIWPLSPLNDYYQTHWRCVSSISDCFLDFWPHFYVIFLCIFVHFHYIFPLSPF